MVGWQQKKSKITTINMTFHVVLASYIASTSHRRIIWVLNLIVNERKLFFFHFHFSFVYWKIKFHLISIHCWCNTTIHHQQWNAESCLRYAFLSKNDSKVQMKNNSQNILNVSSIKWWEYTDRKAHSRLLLCLWPRFHIKNLSS